MAPARLRLTTPYHARQPCCDLVAKGAFDVDAGKTNQPKGKQKQPSVVGWAFSTAANTEPQVGRPRQLLSAALLGVCMIFLSVMLTLPRLDLPLQIALYAFIVAMPPLVIENMAASSKPKPETSGIERLALLALSASAARLAVIGGLAVAVGVVAVVWHIDSIAGRTLLIVTGVAVVVWILLALIVAAVSLWRTARAKQHNEPPSDYEI